MNSATKRSHVIWRLVSLLIVIFLVAVSMAIPPGAQAEKITHADTVLRLQVIENDVFLSGEQPTVNGIVNGDVFIVGSDATVRGDVNGSLFILANEADIQGKVSGNVFAMAGSTQLRSGGTIGRSLYNMSVNLLTEPDSQIGRDLIVTAISANLQGDVRRDSRAVIGLAELMRLLRERFNRSVTGLQVIYPESLTIDASLGVQWETPHFVGNSAGLKVKGDGIAGQTKRAGILGLLPPYLQLQDDTNQAAVLREWLINLFVSLVALLVVGALALWLFPQRFTRWAGMVKSRPLVSAGYGALVLINGLLLPILIIAVVVGIGLGLLYLSLPSIAWMILAAALGLLTVIFSCFLLVVTYLSKAIVAFLVGSLIMARFGQSALSSNRWLALLLGLVLYVILASLPYLGFALGLIVTLLGLGAIWLVYRAPDTPVSPAAAA